MVSNALFLATISVALANQVSAHISIWHPSMFGFNRSVGDPPSRAQDPLAEMTFDQWWGHGHLGYPPHPGDVYEFRVGEMAMLETACDKGATSYYTTSPNGDARDPNNPDTPCPHSPTAQFHTTGLSDVKGCGLAVAYKSDVNDTKPEDYTVFSVNYTCVWNRYTYFEVPQDMPQCPNDQCNCIWGWVHSPDSGSEQMYLTNFHCRFVNTTSTRKLGTPKPARRCGAQPEFNLTADPSNCTYGPKQPHYWLQKERNNQFQPYMFPPFYNGGYNFVNGAQNDIFEDYNTTAPTQVPTNQSTLPSSVVATSQSALPSSVVATSQSALPSSIGATNQSAPHSSVGATNMSSPTPVATPSSGNSSHPTSASHAVSTTTSPALVATPSQSPIGGSAQPQCQAPSSSAPARRSWSHHRRMAGHGHDF